MKIFIQGASSWLGHHMIENLSRSHPDANLFGTHRKSNTPSSSKFTSLKIERNSDSLPHIEELKPDIFINLSRGESEPDFETHLRFIETLNKIDSLYAFASSFNACDAVLDREHQETDEPGAQSNYGIFKAKCERALRERSKRYCVYRFSATHGWAPNRKARTEEFLEKLRHGKEIKVNTGIIQNRTFVGDLTGMMADIAINRGEGVFHIGATDSSEEVQFLRKLAKAFGYSEQMVIKGEHTPTNAVMIPKKIFDLLGEKWKRTEEEAIEQVSASSQLLQYAAR